MITHFKMFAICRGLLLHPAIIFGAPLLPLPSSTPIPMSYDTPLPYKTLWGPYTVSVVRLRDNNGDRFQILDAHGNVLREIKAPRMQEVTYLHLSGRGPADLRVLAFPESNIIHDRRTFVFSRVGGLHNVLVMPDGFDSVRDLGHDGRCELIADTIAPLEYVDDVCHGCSPALMLVLWWDGHRYRIQNRRYPWLARREAYHFREHLLDSLHDSTLPAEARMAPAIGYWANMETVGAGRPALRWLMRKMPRSARREFLAALPDVRVRLARLPHQITVNQQRVIVLAD